MTKVKLLQTLHELVWKDDDMIEQDTLFKMQNIIDKEIILEANSGNLEIEQLDNGYIRKIKIIYK